jgi:hypothetical protein
LASGDGIQRPHCPAVGHQQEDLDADHDEHLYLMPWVWNNYSIPEPVVRACKCHLSRPGSPTHLDPVFYQFFWVFPSTPKRFRSWVSWSVQFHPIPSPLRYRRRSPSSPRLRPQQLVLTSCRRSTAILTSLRDAPPRPSLWRRRPLVRSSRRGLRGRREPGKEGGMPPCLAAAGWGRERG